MLDKVTTFDFESAFNTLDVGIIVLDSRARVVGWNDWIANASQIPKLSAIGKEFDPDELIVLYVPKLKCGLMALNQLALLGWTSIITKDGCTVSDGDFSIHSEIRNGLCV